MIGVIILGILNIVFGRIIIALGSYFQANNHQEVLWSYYYRFRILFPGE